MICYMKKRNIIFWGGVGGVFKDAELPWNSVKLGISVNQICFFVNLRTVYMLVYSMPLTDSGRSRNSSHGSLCESTLI